MDESHWEGVDPRQDVEWFRRYLDEDLALLHDACLTGCQSVQFYSELWSSGSSPTAMAEAFNLARDGGRDLGEIHSGRHEYLGWELRGVTRWPLRWQGLSGGCAVEAVWNIVRYIEATLHRESQIVAKRAAAADEDPPCWCDFGESWWDLLTRDFGAILETRPSWRQFESLNEDLWYWVEREIAAVQWARKRAGGSWQPKSILEDSTKEDLGPIAADTEPKRYCFGWPDVLAAIELNNSLENRTRVRGLNGSPHHPGPIIFGGKGMHPKTNKEKLIEWWNALEKRWEELSQRELDQETTVSQTFPYGREAKVVPQVGGRVKRRRGNQPPKR